MSNVVKVNGKIVLIEENLKPIQCNSKGEPIKEWRRRLKINIKSWILEKIIGKDIVIYNAGNSGMFSMLYLKDTGDLYLSSCESLDVTRHEPQSSRDTDQ